MPRTYAELRRGVEAVLTTGRQEVERAWVQTYHETGRLIAEHLLHHGERADYGAKLYAALARDTGVSVRTLQECVQFYRTFPIARPVAQLGWNQCRLLCQVGDKAERAALIEELKRENLRTVDLKARVRSVNAARRLAAARHVAEPVVVEASAPAGPLRQLRPKRGTPGLYRLLARDDGLAVDAGFKLYRILTAAESRGAAAGGIVRWAAGAFAPVPEATFADLFTYRVTVRRVVDGDTLQVSVALPLYEMDEKLRLRGLDCPELDTPEGKAAKRRAEELIATAREVIITTSKVDKYDRYLADVHLLQPDGEWLFLNNTLLREGHAVPMGNEAMDDWVP